MKYPRVVVSEKVHARVARVAKKQKTTMKAISDKVIIAGLKVLGY